jgi:hypothetical protein
MYLAMSCGMWIFSCKEIVLFSFYVALCLIKHSDLSKTTAVYTAGSTNRSDNNDNVTVMDCLVRVLFKMHFYYTQILTVYK